MSLQLLFEKLALLGAEWVLWLLVFGSVLSIAVMIERALFFRRRRTDLEGLRAQVERHLAKGTSAALEESLIQDGSVEARVALAGIKAASSGAGSAEEAMLAETAARKLEMERGLAFLGTLGSNAPFIGLFGTVIGIIKAFHTLSVSQNPDMKFVMADIAEALVATGVGLIVAIPAVMAHNALQRHIRSILGRAETLGHVVLGHVKAESQEEPKTGSREDETEK